MPRRPGGGRGTPPSPLEEGLRTLVRGIGPSTQKLVHDHSTEVQAIMQAAAPPLGWSVEDKAIAIMAVIYDAVNEISNPRWRAAALAAFRVPFSQYKGPANDSVAGRWRELARQAGADGKEIADSVERYRGYWMTAAHHLAKDLERQFHLLNNSPDGWNARKPASRQPPEPTPPIYFDHIDIIYTFHGQRGVQSIAQCWITTHGDCDHFDAVGTYYSQPDAPIEIVPVANCELDGPICDLPLGGRMGTLKFSRTLHAGENYFFAYTTKFNSDLPCRPAILYEVRTMGMSSLTLRAQFNETAIPTRCWYADSQFDNPRIPEDGSPELLEIPPNGYVEHTFRSCVHGRKYGFRWVWPQDP